MFAIPGILLLVFFIYVRPQEYFTSLKTISPLYTFLGVALFGFIVDLRLRRLRLDPIPQLSWALLFMGWCLLTLFRAPALIAPAAVPLLVLLTLCLLIAHTFQTFRSFQVLMGLLLSIALFLSFVGVHQRLQPRQCLPVTSGRPQPDGRHCETFHECENDEDAEPGVEYTCAHVGMLGTTSVGERVRYLGTLEDPNELALVVGIALPFSFAFFARRRSLFRAVLMGTSLVLVAICAIFTQSRGGQLVLLVVLGAYFIKRSGLKGVALALLVSIPILLLGGRDSEEAESSSEERLECWYAGMNMFREYPIMGVGHTQFTDHHFLTAHNSFVLAPAELGFPGMVLWSAVLYLSIKIPVQALRRLRGAAFGTEADVARTWAMSLLAAWCGMLMGIFFLSFCYKEVLWIFIGVSGAFWSCMRTHDPDFSVRIGMKDLALIAGIDAALVFILYVYTAHKVG